MWISRLSLITIYESSSQFTSHTRAGVNPPLLSSLIRNQILEFRILSLIECSSISNQDSLDPPAEFGPQTDRPKFSGADLDFRNSPKPNPAARALEQREADTQWGRKMVHIRCTHSPAGRDTTDDCRRSPVSPSIVQEQTKHESGWFVAV